MEKSWKVTFACRLGEKEDTKNIFVNGVDEDEALMKVGKLPNHMTHCEHGPLKVIELTPVDGAKEEKLGFSAEEQSNSQNSSFLV